MKKLLILCVDALDYHRVQEYGFPKMPYEKKLSIPRELYYKDNPHSLKVWPSIFSGRIIDTPIYVGPIKKIKSEIVIMTSRALAISKTKVDPKTKKRLRKFSGLGKWMIRPDNVGIETVFDSYDSMIWNIPTITPECIMHFPDRYSMLDYSRREFEVWKMVCYGMSNRDKKLMAAYCHICDVEGHLGLTSKATYMEVQIIISMIKKHHPDLDIMLLSDHGIDDNGKHTKYAYLGCNKPVNAETVMDIRGEIERLLLEEKNE